MEIVKSVKRNPDYIRFGFDVEIVTPEQVEALVCITGSYSEGYGNYLYADIEDMYWEGLKFMGKEVKKDGLVKLYNSVFKEGFSALEERIDKAAEAAVYRNIRHAVENEPKEKIQKLVADLVGKSKGISCYCRCQGDTQWQLIYSGYELVKLMGILGVTPTPYDEILDVENKSSIRTYKTGFTASEIHNATVKD